MTKGMCEEGGVEEEQQMGRGGDCHQRLHAAYMPWTEGSTVEEEEVKAEDGQE